MSVERILHHFPLDPVSRQVRLVLGEKRLPFTEVSVRYWERPRELTKLNPSGMIPVLVETTEGKPPLVLCEGRAILDHLEETCPDPPLFAADPAERAEARRLLHLVRTQVRVRGQRLSSCTRRSRSACWAWAHPTSPTCARAATA